MACVSMTIWIGHCYHRIDSFECVYYLRIVSCINWILDDVFDCSTQVECTNEWVSLQSKKTNLFVNPMLISFHSMTRIYNDFVIFIRIINTAWEIQTTIISTSFTQFTQHEKLEYDDVDIDVYLLDERILPDCHLENGKDSRWLACDSSCDQYFHQHKKQLQHFESKHICANVNWSFPRSFHKPRPKRLHHQEWIVLDKFPLNTI